MSEFGHNYARGSGFCIDSWGTGPFLINAGGKQWRFEDSDMWGPALTKQNGDLLKNPYPPERSPFWRAHFLWRRQGRLVGDDGVCVWHEPKPNVLRCVGKQLVLIERGEPDGLDILDGKPLWKIGI